MKAQASPTERAKPRQAGQLGNAAREEDGDSQVVVALGRGLALLDAFSRNDASLGNAELAERTGLTKPTVSRLAYTLALHNYLSFDPRSREYRLGPRAIRLGAIALATTNVRILALPLMRRLAAGSHFNVGLGTRDDLQVIYTDTAEGDALIALRLFPGSRLPLATSAMGRAYLAACGSDEREDILDRLRSHYGDEWGRIRKGVEDAINEHRRLGYCTSIGDWQKDISGVAVPIAAHPGDCIYVLNLGGPAYALPEKDLREQLAPDLIAIARQVEDILLTGDAAQSPEGTDAAPPNL
ncbi:IclR family transcriptional regulator [Sphingobium sp. Sx8-8]|uniref:IclR family transcriptional regulator n=1 Tax=Sphingobium sp. Sx8-8 TaxID=2933617 RepID=UPI001F5600F8|nr:IclR family transcriptional regulator [Sphingobium sp. Sx8-8]